MISRWITPALALLLLATRAVPAVSDILATDDFTYPDGPLYGNDGGTGWESIWTGSGMDVSAGQAVSNPVGNPPLYGSRSFVNPEAAAGLFISLELRIPAFAIGDYFGVAAASGVNNNQLAFYKAVGSNQLQVGNGGYTAGGPELVAGSTLHLIGAYVKGAAPPGDLMLLWINPDGDDYFDVSTSAHSADIFRVDWAPGHAHHVSLIASLPGVRFDNLVISTSPGGVGLAASIPEPANAPIAAAGLAAGCLVRLRRRRL